MLVFSSIIVIAGLSISCVFIYKKFTNKQKKSHQRRYKSAEKAFKLVQNFDNDAQIIVYLRKLDPFVFEELLLIAVSQNKKCKIIRNDRYTGDGGIDGRFILTQESGQLLYLIQAKRYTNHINNKDLIELSKKVKHEKAYKGLFIHTGKSGKATWQNMFESKNIEIFSGSKLVELIRYGF
ncbi:MAG: restriction endonuclease [Sulfurimonas sp.]|jgi:restriction system protein